MKKEKIEFIDVKDYFRKGIYYHIFIGGRGSGKTYSTLKYCLDSGKKFIYMRRTLDELKECSDSLKFGEGENPFKSLNRDFERNVGLLMLTQKSAGIYNREIDEHGKITYLDQIGYGLALSAIATMRGLDLSDCDILFYDEFITEKHVRKIKAEGEAFLNAIETISRNREIIGNEPMQVVLCANAFNIYNPIFQELGVVARVERMINSGQHNYYSQDRGLGIHLLKNTDSFVNAKSQTSLYKLANGTNFVNMALNNDFIYNDFSCVEYRNIKGYRPVCGFDNCYVFQKKGASEFYLTYAPARCVHYKSGVIQDKKSFYEKFGKLLRNCFIQGNVYFETYDIKNKFLDMIGIQ